MGCYVRTITVRDIYRHGKKRTLVIGGDKPLEEVIKRFAKPYVLRAIFVVDDKQRLIGVITRIDLLNYVKVKLGKWDYLARYPSWKQAIKYMHARKAKDLVHKQSSDAYVKLDDTIEKVLQIMFDYELIDVPVIDNKGRIMGEIGLTEIMLKLLNSSKAN